MKRHKAWPLAGVAVAISEFQVDAVAPGIPHDGDPSKIGRAVAERHGRGAGHYGETRHCRNRDLMGDGESEGRRDAEPRAGEGAGAVRYRNAIEVAEFEPGLSHDATDHGHQGLCVAPAHQIACVDHLTAVANTNGRGTRIEACVEGEDIHGDLLGAFRRCNPPPPITE